HTRFSRDWSSDVCSSDLGRGLSDIIYVKLGRSISAGLISEGRLHRGAQGAAGMIGHSRVGEDLLEAVAGADAIAREGMAAAEDRSEGRRVGKEGRAAGGH